MSSVAPRTKPRSTIGAVAWCPISTVAPACSSPLADVGVEKIAAQRDGVIRQVAVTRPGRGDFALAVSESHTGEAVPSERDRIDVESAQLADRSRCERVTARLVPGDRPLLDDGDVVSCSGQPRGDRGSGRTTADDEDVGVQGACRQPADAGEPAMASGPIGVMSAMARRRRVT